MSSLKKQIRKIDTNLFSGSSDTLRTTLGIYYKITSSFDEDDNNIGTEISSSKPIVTTETQFSNVSAFEIGNNPKIKYVQVNHEKLEETQTGPVVRYRIPVRIIGDEDSIQDDSQWATMLLGGQHGGEQYQQIFTANTYDVYSHDYDTAYTELQRKQILNVSPNQSVDYSTYNISYDYQLYLPQYQNNIFSKTEKELPSMYFNEIYSQGLKDSTGSKGFTSLKNITAFVTREGAYDYTIGDLHTIKDNQLTETPPPFRLLLGSTSTDRNIDNTKYQDMSLYLRQYLTGAFLANDITEETKTNIIQKTSTLYFTGDANDLVLNPLQEPNKDVHKRYPLQARLKIPIHTAPTANTSSYASIIQDNNLQEEVLSYIKGTFVGGTFGGSTATAEFAKELTQRTIDDASSTVRQRVETTTITDSMLDVPDMLLNIAQNPDIGESDTEMFITPDADEISAMKNLNSSFRYTKTLGGMQALQNTLKKMNSSIYDYFKEPILENRTGNQGTDFTDIIDDIKDFNNDPEVIAYRIEKRAGRPVGESRRREKIQDVFFFNNGLSQGGGDMYYYDTQVKYDEEYTYSVYAYMLVQGIRYKYSDLRISRHIGEALSVTAPRGFGGSFGADSDEPHCIEFYDPSSGEFIDQLLNNETNLLSNTPIPFTIRARYFKAYYEAMATSAAAAQASTAWYAQIAAFADFANAGADEGTFAKEIYDYVFGGATSEQYERAEEKYKEFARKLVTYTPTSDIEINGEIVVAAGQKIHLAKLEPNRYATNAQIKAANKYLADFHFEIEPTLKIIQVPLTSKYFTIMDHPPVACDVIPYQRKDDSQIIGFQINRETFPINKSTTKIFNNDSKFGLYPTPISPEEQQVKSTYLLSNNMLPNEIVTKPSVSPPDRVDVYRLDYLPTSLKDFNNNLVFSVKLQYEDDLYYNYSNCLYEEAIATNQKFYYLFKFVNENGMTGYVSPVQVAELIDDGGYKYASFDVLFEDDLKATNPRDPSYDFKKLIQIMPASRHMDIIEEGIDTTTDPRQLIEDDKITVGYADELIWDKKFKFRLTSKKTGRKLDFNITYKLRNS